MAPPARHRPPPEAEAVARAERASRSLEEPLDVRAKRLDPYPVLEVRNPIHRTAYLVLFPAFPDPRPALCTCTDYARRGLGTCKHVEAATRALPRATAPGTRGIAPGFRAPTGVWEEIERRAASLPSPARLSVRDWAGPGSLLYA